jgi:hypothetical protein
LFLRKSKKALGQAVLIVQARIVPLRRLNINIEEKHRLAVLFYNDKSIKNGLQKLIVILDEKGLLCVIIPLY